jgi:hypothetical protein
MTKLIFILQIILMFSLRGCLPGKPEKEPESVLIAVGAANPEIMNILAAALPELNIPPEDGEGTRMIFGLYPCRSEEQALKALETGTADFAVLGGDVLYSRFGFPGVWQNPGRSDIRITGYCGTSPVVLFTSYENRISSLRELRNHTVNTGEPRSDIRRDSRVLLMTAGLRPGRDYREEGLPEEAAARALDRGFLFAAFSRAEPDLFLDRDLRAVSLTQAELARITGSNPGYVTCFFPVTGNPSLETAARIRTAGVPNFLCRRRDSFPGASERLSEAFPADRDMPLILPEKDLF